jgi:hypothetical protein
MMRGNKSRGRHRLPDASSGFLEGTLDAELGLPQLVRARVLDLELLEGTGKLSLDLGLSSALELHADLGGGDGALDLVDVCLKVGLGLMASRELLISGLELLSILDHLVDLSSGETANRVGDACNFVNKSFNRY